MITYKKGNLLDSNCDIIVHQVNCQKVMGSGIAKQIRDRWPDVYSDYCNFIDYGFDNGVCRYSYDFLGSTQFVFVNGKIVVNFFSQDQYLPRGVCHTNYEAFRTCCQNLKHNIKLRCIDGGSVIGFPYKIGCGLAGGDWSIVSKIIEEELSEYNVEIWEYEN